MKIIAKLTVITALLGSTLMADLARVEMGAGAWMSTPSGVITSTESGVTANDISQESETTNPYVWLLIKHPVPVIPNLRLEYASVESEGLASGTFGNFTATGGATKLVMTQYDVIPYYNILDNTGWITLDLGLDLKIVELDYEASDVTGVTGGGSTFNETTMTVIPLFYARTRIEIPTTDIGLEADIKYLTYDTTTVSDARIKVDYTLSFMPVIQPAIEVGYRIQKYDIDEDATGKIDLEFSGVYVGAIVRF